VEAKVRDIKRGGLAKVRSDENTLITEGNQHFRDDRQKKLMLRLNNECF